MSNVSGACSQARLVGLDFGGTSIKAGAADWDGKILQETSAPIELSAGADRVLDQAADLAREMGVQDKLGIGCAGVFDRSNGTLIESPNLRALDGVRLAAELAKRLDIPADCVAYENDANVAALGEQWLGAARGIDNVMVVTLGTGIGGGLVLGGRLFAGPGGMAGEVGHLVVHAHGELCGCGSTGCLETLASATAARRRAIAAGLPTSDPGNLELLSERARAGEEDERALLHGIGVDLGLGLAYVVSLLDINCFVFGGGFAAALDCMRDGVHEGLAQRLFGGRELQLMQASLGGSAGWIGAAKLAFPS
ncbi:MAG: glucokinase [Planctomycetota bacterium]